MRAVGARTHQIGSQWTAHAPRTFLIANGWLSMGFGIPAALAMRERLAIPFVVLDDHWLSLIKVKQERRGLPCYGTEVSPGDYQLPPAHYDGAGNPRRLSRPALGTYQCNSRLCRSA